MGPFFYNEGFRVEVHEPGTTVRVLADSGIPVSSGIETTIRIERTERKRLVSYDFCIIQKQGRI